MTASYATRARVVARARRLIEERPGRPRPEWLGCRLTQLYASPPPDRAMLEAELGMYRQEAEQARIEARELRKTPLPYMPPAELEALAAHIARLADEAEADLAALPDEDEPELMRAFG